MHNKLKRKGFDGLEITIGDVGCKLCGHQAMGACFYSPDNNPSCFCLCRKCIKLVLKDQESAYTELTEEMEEPY